MLKENTKAPLFEAVDQNGESHSLAAYSGKWVLLYFYPRDNTPGCTREACSFKDNYADFAKLDAVVFGVSSNSGESHQKFSDKYGLNFPLLIDTDKKIITAYEAQGPVKRISYLISPQGKIAKAYGKVNVDKHAEEVLADINELIK